MKQLQSPQKMKSYRNEQGKPYQHYLDTSIAKNHSPSKSFSFKDNLHLPSQDMYQPQII